MLGAFAPDPRNPFGGTAELASVGFH
jgi:hypothetical protein